MRVKQIKAEYKTRHNQVQNRLNSGLKRVKTG